MQTKNEEEETKTHCVVVHRSHRTKVDSNKSTQQNEEEEDEDDGNEEMRMNERKEYVYSNTTQWHTEKENERRSDRVEELCVTEYRLKEKSMK